MSNKYEIKTKMEQGQWQLLTWKLLFNAGVGGDWGEGNWLLVEGDFSRWENDDQIFGWWGEDSFSPIPQLGKPWSPLQFEI